MLATEATRIVARLHLAGMLPVRDPAMVEVWHEDIGHLEYPIALEAARWLEGRRGSEAYGQVKPADLLEAVRLVRRDRIETLLGNSPIPAPPAELDHDPAAGVRWQQAWARAAGDGLSLDVATKHADDALGVVRAPEAITNRPVAALAASLAEHLRAPGTREAE